MSGLGCSSPLTLLDCLAEVIVGNDTLRVLTRSGPPPFVLVTGLSITDGRSRGHTIPHVGPRPSLFPQPGIIGEKIGDVFGLLTDICALVLAILVDVLELLKSLDNVEIVAEIYDNVLRTSVQTVIKQSQRLK